MNRLWPGFALTVFLLGSFFCLMQESNASQSDKTRIALFNREKSPLKEVPASSFDSFEKKFVEKNQITVLLDLAELTKSGSILYWTPELDVTEHLIKSYQENEKTATMPLLETPVPETKAAKMDVSVFPEKIRRMTRVYREMAQKLKNLSPTPELEEQLKKSMEEQTKPIRDSLVQALAAFAKERNINLIFSIAGTLPSSIGALPSIDITKSFIEKYNKRQSLTPPHCTGGPL